MLRTILGPAFKFNNLDQFLTLEFCCIFCCFCYFLAEAPIFIVFSAKMQNLNKHKKENTLFVNTPVLTVLVKMSAFSAFFIFAILEFPCFSEMFLIGFQKLKNNKI